MHPAPTGRDPGERRSGSTRRGLVLLQHVDPDLRVPAKPSVSSDTPRQHAIRRWGRWTSWNASCGRCGRRLARGRRRDRCARTFQLEYLQPWHSLCRRVRNRGNRRRGQQVFRETAPRLVQLAREDHSYWAHPTCTDIAVSIDRRTFTSRSKRRTWNDSSCSWPTTSRRPGARQRTSSSRRSRARRAKRSTSASSASTRR